MSLSIAEIRRIIERHPLPEKYSKEQMQQWIIELGAEIANNLIESVETSEKLVSKEDIKQLIELSNIRFEALQKEMNARFDAINQRFEALQKEQMALRQEMNARFEAMENQMLPVLKHCKNKLMVCKNRLHLCNGGSASVVELHFYSSYSNSSFRTFFHIRKFFSFPSNIFFIFVPNKIQTMYNVSLHNILQVASRKSQVKLVHLKFYKVKPFFLSFQTFIHKNFFFSFFLSLLSYFDSSKFINDHHLNQRSLRSIVFQRNADNADDYDKI